MLPILALPLPLRRSFPLTLGSAFDRVFDPVPQGVLGVRNVELLVGPVLHNVIDDLGGRSSNPTVLADSLKTVASGNYVI